MPGVRLGGIIPNHLSLGQADNPFPAYLAPSRALSAFFSRSRRLPFYSRESSQYADKGLTTPIPKKLEDRLRGCKDFFRSTPLLLSSRPNGLSTPNPDFAKPFGEKEDHCSTNILTALRKGFQTDEDISRLFLRVFPSRVQQNGRLLKYLPPASFNVS